MLPFKPEFFDIFGAIGFIYIIIFSYRVLLGKNVPKWATVALLLIGIIGLLVDSIIVYTFYF